MQPLATENCLINGGRIAYGVFGQGEPLVLVHGTPSSSLIWRNVVPSLTKAGYRVHVFDLLGYGLSERPWDSSIDTSISGQVPILEGLLSHWELRETHIVAHDIGGAIAQRFAVQSPRRVKTLTLIDTVSFDSYPSKRTKQQMQVGLESLIKKSDHDHRAHFREWLLSAVHDKEKFAASSLDTFLDYISGPVGQGSLFEHQIRHYDPKHTMEIVEKLPSLGQLPVHIIWGAEDGWQIVDWAHRLNQAIPGSKLDIVEGRGHFSLEDKPDEISKLVLDFLTP
ncbi:alpha/beta hydrolase [Penicillium hispanicum]|uniref:alpha/beta hydrolase n=1 Tax=Penicillium hispanicum TaxID=1080232 RepID=UPI0025408CD4|nr:alpha/beta hydrolase [Penicillium hispanicum]KAJ5587859.1 alpha/beta hydrolase [Penicillium hispanicum]